MKFTDRDLLAIILIAILTAAIIGLDIINHINPEGKLLDVAVVGGALLFIYRVGRNGQ